MKMGHAGPPFEPRRRPQAGKSGDPRSQNADTIGTTPKTSVSPIAFESSKPFPLHSCKLHALLSAVHILFACLLELCEDCLTCAKIAKNCQELKLGKG